MNKYPMVKLGDLFSNKITGEWGKDCNNNGIFVIRTTNFTQNGVINLDNIVLRDIPIKKVKEKRLFSNDIILEKSGGTENTPVGRVVYCDDRINQNTYLCNNFTIALRTNQNIAFSKYVFYFMWFYHKIGAVKLLQNQTTGIRNLQVKSYMNIKIPLPSIEEQRHIANVLDKVTAQIDNCNKILQNLDLLVKSKFVQMFGDPVSNPMGWEENLLNSLGELNRGVSKHRPRNDISLLNGKYPLIQTGDIAKSNLYIEEYESTYSELGLKQSKMWEKGTLCITIAGNIAKTGILTFNACFPDSVVGFIGNEKVSQIFIHYWFSFFQKILEEQAPQVAQKNINLKILNNLIVITPPIELQNQFAEFVENVEKQKTTTQNTLNQLETLKNALMQEYFN